MCVCDVCFKQGGRERAREPHWPSMFATAGLEKLLKLLASFVVDDSRVTLHLKVDAL